MRYKFVRVRAGEVKSGNPLRDEEIEFESEEFPLPIGGERFSFSTAPRDGGSARLVSTSVVRSIYQIDEDGSVGFTTESGSVYQIRRV